MILRPDQKVLEKHGLNSLAGTDDLIVHANKTELIEVLKPMYLMPSGSGAEAGGVRRKGISDQTDHSNRTTDLSGILATSTPSLLTTSNSAPSTISSLRIFSASISFAACAASI